MNIIDDDILSENEIMVYLPYDEHTERHIPWSKYRMEILQEFGMDEEHNIEVNHGESNK